jgi:hypothetical protein
LDFISVLCLDGRLNLLLVSLSNVVGVGLLVNNDDVRVRDTIGGSISRLLVVAIVVNENSSLLPKNKSSIIGCFTED